SPHFSWFHAHSVRIPGKHSGFLGGRGRGIHRVGTGGAAVEHNGACTESARNGRRRGRPRRGRTEFGRKENAPGRCGASAGPGLAQRAGFPLDTLRGWEQERHLPRINDAYRLAKALGKNIEELILRSDMEQESAAGPAPRRGRPPKGKPTEPPAA